MTIDPAVPASLAVGRIDPARVDATTQEDIAAHQAADQVGAMQDAAKFARRVRKRLGLSQAEFSQRITDRIRHNFLNHWAVAIASIVVIVIVTLAGFTEAIGKLINATSGLLGNS